MKNSKAKSSNDSYPKAATKAANKKPDAERTWKQFEDHLIPRLRLSVIDRALYSHLLRHSRLEGKRRLRFSILELARRVGLSTQPVRNAIRRLIAYDVLRLVQRTSAGHVVEVRLPKDIRAVRAASPDAVAESRAASASAHKELICPPGRAAHADFFHRPELRRAVHAREAGVCFYCRKRLTRFTMCLDHVIPRVYSGRNGYRNLVSCCAECNALKGQRSAKEFLRKLYREGSLSGSELKMRMGALRALAAGKLVPRV